MGHTCNGRLKIKIHNKKEIKLKGCLSITLFYILIKLRPYFAQRLAVLKRKGCRFDNLFANGECVTAIRKECKRRHSDCYLWSIAFIFRSMVGGDKKKRLSF